MFCLRVSCLAVSPIIAPRVAQLLMTNLQRCIRPSQLQAIVGRQHPVKPASLVTACAGWARPAAQRSTAVQCCSEAGPHCGKHRARTSTLRCLSAPSTALHSGPGLSAPPSHETQLAGMLASDSETHFAPDTSVHRENLAVLGAGTGLDDFDTMCAIVTGAQMRTVGSLPVSLRAKYAVATALMANGCNR